MKECGNCKRCDRISKRLGICTDDNEAVALSNPGCSNYDERQKISKEKLLAIATEAARLYFDYNYSVEDAITMAKQNYEVTETKG